MKTNSTLDMLSDCMTFLMWNKKDKKDHLILDGSVDLIESGDSSQLLRDLLIVGPLLGVLTKLSTKTLEANPLLQN